MKKRFTIMLEDYNINLIKALYDYYKPTYVRKKLEKIIVDFTIEELSSYKSKKLTRYLNYGKK